MAVILPSITDHFKHTWAIFKQKYKTLVLIQLVPLIGVIPLLVLTSASKIFDPKIKHDLNLSADPIWWILGFGAIILAALIQIWAQAAMIYAIDDANPKPHFKTAFVRARPVILPFLAASLLAGLIILGGFILLIIPGIIFLFWYSMTTYVVALEDKRGMDALRTSKSYVKGNSLHVALRFFAMLVVLIVINTVVSSIFSAMHAPALAQLWSLAVALVYGPFAAVYGYLIYRGLKGTSPLAQATLPTA